MKQAIVGYHTDQEGDWVAELSCGHNQHIRHDPPWMNRAWATTPTGRASRLGDSLDCKKCDDHAPPDHSSAA